MATIADLWLAALTKDEDDAGTHERLNLTVTVDGVDLYAQDFVLASGTTVGPGGAAQAVPDLDQAEAGLAEGASPPPPFDAAMLTDSSFRLGIRGDDAWGPQHVLVIGKTQSDFRPGRFVALAMETDLPHWLSSDSSEGHLTMPIRLVGSGDAATTIRRVLMVVHTGGGNDVGTDSAVRLQIATGSAVVLSEIVPDTAQDDLDQSTTNWYFFDVGTPFTRGDLAAGGSVRLSGLGDDAWLAGTVFLFGLDTASGRPSQVVTLAAIPHWGLGALSTDTQEGSTSIDLPLSI